LKEIPWKPITPQIRAALCCPRCNKPLRDEGDTLCCVQPDCGLVFPVVADIPILLNEENSLFKINDYLRSDAIAERTPAKPNRLVDWLPSISLNLVSDQNYQKFAQALLEKAAHPKVLVIGGRITGKGMEKLDAYPDLEIVSSDIAYGPRTQIILDGHNIPFQDSSFDGIIVQAVLEHVLDPVRCVAEIHRVLRQGGLVYAETPFMQQVHEGCYDFTRFTHLGHRRLFRWFEEIASGPSGGPGMALAWSWRYFLLSFATKPVWREILGGLARITAFFWKYFDPLIAAKAGGMDAAAGYYFLGRKSETPLSDKTLIEQYRGAINNG
jgi:SAM-dependent methyltransferase